MPETVDLVASGYEWCCPNCGHANTEIEAVTGEVVCGQGSKDIMDVRDAASGITSEGRAAEIIKAAHNTCGHKFQAGPPEHAYA